MRIMKFAKGDKLSYAIRHLVATRPNATVKLLHTMGATDTEIIEAYSKGSNGLPFPKCMFHGSEKLCNFEENGLALPHTYRDWHKVVWLCDRHFLQLQDDQNRLERKIV